MSKKTPTRSTDTKSVAKKISQTDTSPADTFPADKSANAPNYWLYATYVLLFVVVWVLYQAGFGNEFVDWDDYEYVKENSYVLRPSWSNAVTLLKTAYFGNYHPLTMWSYMATAAWIGKDAGSFIMVNVLLHAINACLVAYFAYRLSGRVVWVAALTALFFAVHPLHVESVVWVSERKDVLYGLFFLAACIGYLRYLDRPTAWRYAVVWSLFLLSCLSKPAAIILPIVLLLLDDWHNRSWLLPRVWAEKIPFFALSFLFGSIALSIQNGGDFMGLLPTSSAKAFAVSHLDISWVQRCQDAAYALMTYLIRLFVPHSMAAYHPYPATYDSPVFVLYPLLAIALFATAIYSRRYTKILFFGFMFYLVCLLLVLQFVSVGSAIIAERYTYLPYIGILFALFYGLHRLSENRPVAWRTAVGGAAIVVALLFAVRTHNYIPAWKNTLALWDNVIQYYPDVAKPYTLRGTFKGKSGDLAAAIKDFEHALSLDTVYAATYEGLGNAYGFQGQPQKALAMFEKALQYDPNNGKSYYNRALANVQLQQFDRVLPDLDRALELTPNRAGEIASLRGYIYLQQKKYADAVNAYGQALQIQPTAAAYCYRGVAQMNLNNHTAARADLQRALQIDPNMAEAKQYLAQIPQ